jgi:phosphoglycolate phosphatase
MNRLVIFDCDGTLVDSGATITRAVAETFEQHGLAAPPPRECRRVIGLGLSEAIAILAPKASANQRAVLTESYKAKFFHARLEGRVEEPLFDGIAELFDALEADGWLLAAATGKSDRGLGHCLECHGLASRFVSLQTGDRHPSKPHPSMALQAMADAGAAPETTVVIGDTSYDMGMARAAGATGIGAGWGYHDERELLAAGAIAVAREPGEVIQLLPHGENKLYG